MVYLHRLKSLALASNRITKIYDISESLPNLENVNLMNNKISDITEFYNLRKCKKLRRLFVHGNNIC